MAITLFGSASTPTDNGTNTTNPTVVTPPASMLSGDLVILLCWKRNAATGIAMSAAGGQAWSVLSPETVNTLTATLTTASFWCTFNGTWSTNPSVAFGATTNNNVLMLVFRPTGSGYSWSLGLVTTPTFQNAAVSHTMNALVPNKSSNVSVSIMHTDDDNTWTFSGTNWIKTNLSAQYRNTSGSDASASVAYQIQTVAASTNQVTHTEATLGNDPGSLYGFWFYEAQNRIPRPSSCGHPFIM